MSENKEPSNSHDEDKKPVKDDASNLENIQVENELDAGELDEDNASPIGESNEELQTKNEELQTKNEELKDQLMRTLAESENLRKRTIKDVDQAKKYSHISLRHKKGLIALLFTRISLIFIDITPHDRALNHEQSVIRFF